MCPTGSDTGSGPETAPGRIHIDSGRFWKRYSSLNMLKDIEVDVLKIDMQFCLAAYLRERKIILESVIQMANNLGMPGCMEGVETQEQKAVLIQNRL